MTIMIRKIFYLAASGSLPVILAIMSVVSVHAQDHFNYIDHSGDNINLLRKEFGLHKKIPVQFELPILLALSHFPELKDMHIKFRVKHAYTPLTTRPDMASMFLPRGLRTYVITISDRTIDTLSHLLYAHLDLEEQIGIMGHELSHVTDFSSKTFLESVLSLAGHLSAANVDKMEYHTDMICIQHGLGKYLEAYSMHVRKVMHVHNWRGVDYVLNNDQLHERYMNPGTIEKNIDPD
jgi:hypothetical protein